MVYMKSALKLGNGLSGQWKFPPAFGFMTLLNKVISHSLDEAMEGTWRL